MRPSMSVMSLLLLLLLIATTTAQGIEFKEQSFATFSKRNHEGSLVGQVTAEDGGAPPCRNDASLSGRIRKLLSKAMPGTKTEKSSDIRREEADTNQKVFSAHAATASEQAKRHQGTYPEALDMSEMDYSPAKRKPPIHN